MGQVQLPNVQLTGINQLFVSCQCAFCNEMRTDYYGVENYKPQTIGQILKEADQKLKEKRDGVS